MPACGGITEGGLNSRSDVIHPNNFFRRKKLLHAPKHPQAPLAVATGDRIGVAILFEFQRVDVVAGGQVAVRAQRQAELARLARCRAGGCTAHGAGDIHGARGTPNGWTRSRENT